MSTIRKLASGKYNATGYYKDPITGKISRPSFTASSKAEARRIASEWEENKRISALPKEMTIKECIDRYIKSKETTLSPSTIRGYKTLQTHNYAGIENLRLKDVSDEILQLFVSNLNKKFAPKHVRNIYSLLSSSLKMFTKKTYNVSLPQKQVLELHVPTDDQVKLLMDNACPSMKKAIALAAIGTLRNGEVCALKYCDIDYDKNTVYVHSDMVKGPDGKWVVKDIPKTSTSTRYIPLPDKVIELLGHGEPDDYVYGRVPSSIDSGFNRLRERVGFYCRFHDLRHYAASIMHALGIPDQYIMERGGWKSDRVLKAVYRNTLSDQSEKFSQVANNHFSELL